MTDPGRKFQLSWFSKIWRMSILGSHGKSQLVWCKSRVRPVRPNGCCWPGNSMEAFRTHFPLNMTIAELYICFQQFMKPIFHHVHGISPFFQRWNGRIRWATLHVQPQQTTTQTCAMVKNVAHIGGWSSVDYIMEIHSTSYHVYCTMLWLWYTWIHMVYPIYPCTLSDLGMAKDGFVPISLVIVRWNLDIPKLWTYWLRSIFGCSKLHVFKDRTKNTIKCICKHCTWWISHQLEIFGGFSFPW